MSINVQDQTIQQRFFDKGDVVFKVTLYKTGKDVSIVNTREDYERKWDSHIKNPLLDFVNMYVRLAYLYGCLHKKDTYQFLWREVCTDEWYEWFSVRSLETLD